MSYHGKYCLHPLAVAMVCLLSAPVAYADEIVNSVNEETELDAKNAIELGRILVKAQSESEEGEAQGYDEVYSGNKSTVFRGKEEIQRNRGTSPADILKGMTGVFSGDSRNSGSVDVNIRGIQGHGRVPVTIDGTEQSVAVYRGYFGVSNRNYLDPSLISSVTVEKGGAISPGTKTSVGGGVAMKTLGIDDVVPIDKKFGIDYLFDTGSNTTRPRLPDMSPIGTDFRDDPNKLGGALSTHPNIIKDPKKRGGSSDWFNFRDGSARVAAGYRGEIFDVMGALSYRKQGNYFSGKNGASKYYGENTKDQAYMAQVADIYEPGSEVLNTSSTNRSFLLKNTWYLPDDQRLLLTARQSIIEHGELMPSRIIRYADGGIQQWPIGKINQRAYSAQYKWDPDDNPWINTNINLWKTTTNSNTYTGSGYVFDLDLSNPNFDSGWYYCTLYSPGNCPKTDKDDVTANYYVNNALSHARDHRWGITADNTMEILDNLKFTAGIDFQREKLRSETKTREGRRRTTSLMMNFEWKPIPSVTINAGVKRNSYSSFDDLLAEGRAKGDVSFNRRGLGYYRFAFGRMMDQAEYDNHQRLSEKQAAMTAAERREWRRTEEGQQYTLLNDAVSNKGYIEEKTDFVQREDGRFYREDNPLLNGSYSNDKSKVINPATGEEVDRYTYSVDKRLSYKNPKDPNGKVTRKSGHAWSPIFSVGWEMTDNSRVYARYAKDSRFPSMFETSINSFNTAVRDDIILKPERSRNLEFGYVYDFSWLPGIEAGDIKLSYYDMKLKDVFERDTNMMMTQIDEQRTKGIELQARYSDGKYFATAGINYNLKNKTCDESSSLALDPTGKFPGCVDGGFPIGFLRTNMIPKYSLNLTVGGKFFSDKLEVGTSLNYHGKARNGQEEQMMRDGLIVSDGMNNNPIRWNSVFLVDVFMKYKIDKDLTINFSGQNLTNQYYIDPLTRSFMPSPGRTFRIGFEGKL